MTICGGHRAAFPHVHATVEFESHCEIYEILSSLMQSNVVLRQLYYYYQRFHFGIIVKTLGETCYTSLVPDADEIVFFLFMVFFGTVLGGLLEHSRFYYINFDTLRFKVPVLKLNEHI